MTHSRESIAANALALTDAVLKDWRWVGDDMSVSTLGMILYGFTRAMAKHWGLQDPDAEAVVLQCLMERTGAAAKWSGGLIDAARASAESDERHRGNSGMIAVGAGYQGTNDLHALVNNVFDNIASVRKSSGAPEPMIVVFLNPLYMLLAARERKKGSPLTEAEVLKVRDGAACTQMPLSQAEKFFASLDARMPIPRLNPQRIWEEWQAVRESAVDHTGKQKRWWQFWRNP